MKDKVLITGGAGFIGINSAEYFLNKKFEVIVLDNFSRKGTRQNIVNLRKKKFFKNNLKGRIDWPRTHTTQKQLKYCQV